MVILGEIEAINAVEDFDTKVDKDETLKPRLFVAASNRSMHNLEQRKNVNKVYTLIHPGLWWV